MPSSLITTQDLEVDDDERQQQQQQQQQQVQSQHPSQPLYSNDAKTSTIMPEILSLSFNQDGGCLAIGLTTGFIICNVYPFQEAFHRNTEGGGIGLVEMLFRCNLLALVGGGPQPKYPRNKVMLWDDHRGKPIGELSFRQNVLNVKLRRDRVVVVLYDRIYLYNFSDLTLLDQIPTMSNPKGLVCLSPDNTGVITEAGGSSGGGGVLACPSIHRGGVRVELYGYRKTQLIDAHESPLAALALTVDGLLLATASEKGTLVRIFSTKDSALIYEFRRGVERASISCLAFSLCKSWLGVCSDRGTAHIFQLRQHLPPSQLPQQTHNPHESGKLGAVWKKVKPWVSSSDGNGYSSIEGSYAQVRGIRNPYICAFVPDRPTTLAVVDKDNACMLLADFGKGGEADRVSYHVLFKQQKNNTAAATKLNYNPLDYSADNADIVFGEEEEDEGFVSVERQHHQVANSNSIEQQKKGSVFVTTGM